MFETLPFENDKDRKAQVGGSASMSSKEDPETFYGECDNCGAYRDLIAVNMIYGKTFLCPDCLIKLKEKGEIQ